MFHNVKCNVNYNKWIIYIYIYHSLINKQVDLDANGINTTTTTESSRSWYYSFVWLKYP